MEQQQSNAVNVSDELSTETDEQKKLHAYFNGLPPGFRFCPTDEELINKYLIKKVKNQSMPVNRIVDVNLYQYNPEYLAEKYKKFGENAWYFFTSTEKKYRFGTRPRRDARNGYWKATGTDKSIESNDLPVGLKKSLVFYRGKKNDESQKTNWIMHEYRIDDNSSQRNSRKGTANMKLDDWVLCRIYENRKGSSTSIAATAKEKQTAVGDGDVKKRKSDEANEDGAPAEKAKIEVVEEVVSEKKEKKSKEESKVESSDEEKSEKKKKKKHKEKDEAVSPDTKKSEKKKKKDKEEAEEVTTNGGSAEKSAKEEEKQSKAKTWRKRARKQRFVMG